MIKKLFSFPGVLLPTVLLLALAVRLYNINYNSAFLDEGIYIVIGKKVFDGIWEADAPFGWVGGMPLFYPVISAAAFSLWGLLGSRIVNVILGVLATYFIFVFSKNITFFKKENENFIAGIIASSFFAIAAVPVWLSRIAIYDMLCITLFLFALVQLQKGFRTNNLYSYLAASILAFLSFLAKYSVLMTFPILIIAPIFLGIKYKKTQRDNAIFFVIIFLFLQVSYLGIFASDLQTFFASQVVNSGHPTQIQILLDYWQYMGIWLLLALPGFILLVKNKHYLYASLFLMAFIPLLMNMISKNDDTVHQNSIFGLIILLPLIGFSLTKVIKRKKIMGTLLIPVISIPIFIYSYQQISDLGRFWPNTDNITNYLTMHISENDIVLLESGDSVYMHLYDKLEPENVSGPFVFSYNGYEGEEGYVQALEDKHFTYVQLESSSLTESEAFKEALNANYLLVFEEGENKVYRKQ